MRVDFFFLKMGAANNSGFQMLFSNSEVKGSSSFAITGCNEQE
jgi:hypothetical protein